jgi:nicotinamidase-related amidase
MDWRDEVERLPRLAPTEFEIEPGKTGLVIVDMQYVDAHREYGLGKSLKESHPEVWEYYFDRVESLVIPNIKRCLETFRQLRLQVIYLTIGAVLPDGGDMVPLRRPQGSPGLSPLFYHAGTFEHGILEELAPVEGELVINKTSRSAFNSTAIERTVRNLGLDALFFVGVTTSSCVDTSARDAADRGFKTVIVEDATAELDEPSHEAALRQFAVRWGRVWTTDETTELLDGLAQADASAHAEPATA